MLKYMYSSDTLYRKRKLLRDIDVLGKVLKTRTALDVRRLPTLLRTSKRLFAAVHKRLETIAQIVELIGISEATYHRILAKDFNMHKIIKWAEQTAKKQWWTKSAQRRKNCPCLLRFDWPRPIDSESGRGKGLGRSENKRPETRRSYRIKKWEKINFE
ncbi:hypothetical protein TNCV_499641 [Trichonephila clavipes]|nr:hypothetical protein TNCV_499641 [Trichonephila clavipes]